MSFIVGLGIQPDALVDETGEGTDYVLQDVNSCWVEVGSIALYIRRSEGGVIVEAFESGDEMGDMLGSMEVEL